MARRSGLRSGNSMANYCQIMPDFLSRPAVGQNVKPTTAAGNFLEKISLRLHPKMQPGEQLKFGSVKLKYCCYRCNARRRGLTYRRLALESVAIWPSFTAIWARPREFEGIFHNCGLVENFSSVNWSTQLYPKTSIIFRMCRALRKTFFHASN